MTKILQKRIFTILAVFAACIYFAFPIDQRINLGLDLKGGMHLIMKVETEKLSEDARKDAVARAMEILRNRIDSLGVGETVVQQQGEDQILVQLPGVTDRDKALAMVKRVAHLEFRMVESDPQKLERAVQGNAIAGYELQYLEEEGGAPEPILLEKRVALGGDAISDAAVGFTQFNQPQINISLNSKGAKAFGKLTTDHVGERMAIIMDGKVLSAPTINEPILSGSGVITGNFTAKEASVLSLALRSGALPAPMRVEEERTIGPLLGQDSIDAGIRATVIGCSLVIFFMIAYYRVAGVVSAIALLFNLFLLVGIMGFISVMLPANPLTLTLPGIAGIVLTLGMAVDANVLINERIREEMDNGGRLAGAINAGFSKAFTAIIDSNLTTLIAAFMLFQFGSGPIKGFAVTLSIGLLASLFTALYVTRTLFSLLVEVGGVKKLGMGRLLSKANFDFLGKRYICYAISIILLIGGMVSFFQKGQDAYGIDFVGGQIQEYRFQQPIDADKLREALKSANVANAVIQQFDQFPENVIIRTPDDKDETFTQVSDALKTSFPDNAFEVLRVEKVGPIVGKALRGRAIMAILFALGGILIFVGFRFRHFDFALAGIVALLHDVLVAVGLLTVFGGQIDLLVVTALLTIAGYSINDTIIIYDRVRENMGNNKRRSLAEVLNLSINQTLGRTLLTTLSTLLVVITLYLKGGEVLNTFALCLLIGFVAGTYSTVFIASPVVLLCQRFKK